VVAYSQMVLLWLCGL